MGPDQGNIDVAIVGGGFAGAVAARELTSRGYSSVILEARDRLGGRTLTRHWHGQRIELGGQWIHWLQPHVWAEVSRYGLKLYERALVHKAWWITDGAVCTGSFDEFHHVYMEAWEKLYAGAMDAFPRPHEPLMALERLQLLDGISVGQRIHQLGLTGGARDIVRAIASVQFNSPADQGALTQGLRRLAMTGGHAELLAQTLAQYKLLDGTNALLTAILSQADVRIELSTVVQAITANADGVELVTSSGARYVAGAAIVTVPINTLGAIDFSPALSRGKQAMAREGQMTRGAMYWLLLRNVPKHFLLVAPPENPLTFVRFDAEQDGIVLANAFAPESTRISDCKVLESAIRRWLPNAEIVDFTSHDWVSDPYSRQTWAMLKRDQLTSHFADLQRSEGPIFFAGADYASGWFGFIDGAIQSAYVTARSVGERLEHASRPERGPVTRQRKKKDSKK